MGYKEEDTIRDALGEATSAEEAARALLWAHYDMDVSHERYLSFVEEAEETWGRREIDEAWLPNHPPLG